MRFLDSDVPAETLSAAELEGIRSALRFYNRDSLTSRLVATIDALIEQAFPIRD